LESGLVGGGDLAIGELFGQIGEIHLDPRPEVRVLVDLELDQLGLRELHAGCLDLGAHRGFGLWGHALFRQEAGQVVALA